ncbi:hypothetical protein [Nitrosomonas ureae]|uniref:Uncharacterized protein n=1 Tax=Nitrosomonas ureae TaxID=44577 RepID=A0A2T5IIN9_9PROT|nr:hypothetical protein [Nitrosomonas ureae]PTQ83678.1 hypothetical protein C8R28_10222 [Nitrosomonas ureae]
MKLVCTQTWQATLLIKKLEESKSNLRKLADSIQDANERSYPMQKIKDKLLIEIYDLEGAIAPIDQSCV